MRRQHVGFATGAAVLLGACVAVGVAARHAIIEGAQRRRDAEAAEEAEKLRQWNLDAAYRKECEERMEADRVRALRESDAQQRAAQERLHSGDMGAGGIDPRDAEIRELQERVNRLERERGH